ncbi:proliferating cell nuclear antigen [Turbot reddish body iridovirus]|uniref:Proliferating cell nuclear antigen n=1 Tax=Turbot reddish body iridovirus TaxID=273651 RepID=E2CU47_ISKNV|nr:proliferating cell nuclear antigen [Turbot reddish body iridovirus]
MLFHAESSHPNKIKSLIELLYANAETVYFRISKEGMQFVHVIHDVHIYANLHASGFDTYHFDAPTEAVYVGLGQHTARDFKTVRKGSRVSFKLHGAEPMQFEVQVGAQGGGSVTFITAVETYAAAFERPAEHTYMDTFTLCTADFSSMCRGFKPGTMTIDAVLGAEVRMSMCIEGFKTKTYRFGRGDGSVTPQYHAEVSSDRILKLAKMAAFADTKTGVLLSVGDTGLKFVASCRLGTVEVHVAVTR